MKKSIKVILIILGFIIFIPLSKNLFLYYKYHHNEKVMKRVEGDKNKLVGKWELNFDTIYCGIDENHNFILNIDSDSTAQMKYIYLGEKIDGDYTTVYSWRSLLPFDKDKSRETNYKVILSKSDFICIPTRSNEKDTVYYQYKFINDSLYVRDYYREWKNENDWGMTYSLDADLLTLIDVRYIFQDWYSLFIEII